ncbi:glycerate kinase, partial [Muricomes intestini]|uniref:glycerate kinase n=1 Tax=Muricomes intestini TaxID=1796634 RepID=UPI002FE42371
AGPAGRAPGRCRSRCPRASSGRGGGAAAAAGVKFYDADGKEFVPTGGNTIKINKMDLAGMDSALKNVEIVTMCDIDNPMYGPAGAAYIFGPQKGADEKMVLELDEGLVNLSKVIEKTTGENVSQIPGAGAAGA